ncbi:carboxymuconolactone decarboxylase family protein [Mycobacterium sp.]|uniref:carboxymuconolactone decarboxylase family protein n=1 Tax=Mycobacterium sp. TaxID=1785 RepID=UPI0025EAB9BC|nr:carboxymuconolactone decarboxylase family protein [Mycobacterium sp.]MBW0015373.1 carboxymuconolactone decarboxylase family protein [Mycobacterium sp.]
MRVQPLPAEGWDEAVRRSLSGMLPPERCNPRDAGNLMSTLARHPDLAHAYLRFGGYLLLRSTLPAHIREQAILRVAHRRACAYEWAHHVKLAKQAGLSDAHIVAAQTGESDDEFERAVFDAVDELDEKSNLSDQTWTALCRRLDERQRMDLIFTIGGYVALAMALNAFGVRPENER